MKRVFQLPEEVKIINYLKNIEINSYYKYNIAKCWPIDQKVTFDVLNLVCKCVVNFVKNKNFCFLYFNHKEFLKDKYSINIFQNKTESNGKAKISDKTYKEYDKIFWNNFELLSYIEVFEKKIQGRKKYFKIKNFKILELLSQSEESCIALICEVVYKLISSNINLLEKLNVLIQNGENFLKKREQDFFKSFENWMLENTKHKSDIPQIYKKIINPLFYLFQLKKYNGNKNTKNLPQLRADLCYFRIHDRDKNKTHGLTRKENIVNKMLIHKKNFYENEIKNKAYVKYLNHEFYQNKFNLNDSEYISEFSDNFSTLTTDILEIHHIWPKNKIRDNFNLSPHIIENLILLSKNEHGKLTGINKKEISYKHLSNVLWKQFDKILQFNKKLINNKKYSLFKFYKLICYILEIQPNMELEICNENNREKLISYIFELILCIEKDMLNLKK